MAGELPERVVREIHEVYGCHPGFRAAHAKGTFCTGTFSATSEAAAMTTAAHMQGAPVDVIARFSKGAGDPTWPDAARDTRGMAVKFRPLSGTETDIVAATMPSFFASTPEGFISFLRAMRPIRGTKRLLSPLRVGRFMWSHREARPAVWSVITIKPALSFATTRYNALHAYRWIDPGGTVRNVRYSWVPEAGEIGIGRRKAKKAGPDYLQRELVSRLADTEVAFTLQVQIAEEGDDLDDPTSPWPIERETVDAGRLTLDRALPDPDPDIEALAMDPTRIVPGIELSDDPVLRLRGGAYPVSAERRGEVRRTVEGG